jgi:hypothetical protein
MRFKPFAYLPAALLLTACADQPAADSHDAFWAHTRPDSVVLKQGLGTVYLRVPKTYDTLLVWTRKDGCITCGSVFKHRLQPRNLPIQLEYNYNYQNNGGRPPLLDSVYQLTVGHAEFPDQLEDEQETLKKDSTSIFKEHPRKVRTYAWKGTKLDFDTLEKINGRLFSVVAYSGYSSKLHGYYHCLNAETMLHGEGLHFQYELRTRQNDSLSRHFQRDALRLLRTVRLRPGH